MLTSVTFSFLGRTKASQERCYLALKASRTGGMIGRKFSHFFPSMKFTKRRQAFLLATTTTTAAAFNLKLSYKIMDVQTWRLSFFPMSN